MDLQLAIGKAEADSQRKKVVEYHIQITGIDTIQQRHFFWYRRIGDCYVKPEDGNCEK